MALEQGERVHIAVVGAGPVGCTISMFLAKRGYKVEIYEKREDCRTAVTTQRKSINLTLSVRGREPLRALGLEDTVLKLTVPVCGRMIHPESGDVSTSNYSINGDCLYSLDRLTLNKLLLDQAENHPNIALHFQHELVSADLSRKKLFFTRPGEEKIEVQRDFIFGCDGAFSSIRQSMKEMEKTDFTQEIIDHGYKEFSMPAEDGKYAMDGDRLHVWPRGEFMLLALPNLDHSFTVTLFMPHDEFNSITNEETFLAFFAKNFPDALEKIGPEKLVQDYLNNPTSKLTSVKCEQHVMDGTVLLGDAAHAVVPFFGQGMNAGLEDCLIFSELLTKNDNSLTKAASEYSVTHWRDCHAIADLSMENYVYLRSQVDSKISKLRKDIEDFLHHRYPQFYTPLYSMVAFSRIPYHEAVAKDQKQRKIVDVLSLWITSLF